MTIIEHTYIHTSFVQHACNLFFIFKTIKMQLWTKVILLRMYNVTGAYYKIIPKWICTDCIFITVPIPTHVN